MRTLQEKYNGIQEGKFSKEHFLAEARMQQPQLVTRFNGYDDAVQILKNKGMIVEAKKQEGRKVTDHPFIVYTDKQGKHHIEEINYEDDQKAFFKTIPNTWDVYETRKEAAAEKQRRAKEAKKETVKEDYSRVLELPDGNYFAIDGDWEDEYQGNNGLFFTVKGNSVYDKNGEAIQSSPREFISQFTPEEILKVENVNEAKQTKLTKKSLTDYRYKPTNEMDKYPYEQILRGLRVELEGLGVNGTPTAEEYAKALSKVSKNLAKDSIFYTNQVAGVNPKVDQHDQMVTATAKNTVDTFNGMKKAELKEGFKKLIKKVLSESMGDMFGDEERAQRKVNYGQPGEDEYDFYSDPENYKDEEEFELQGDDEIDYDDENFSDPFIDGDLDENKYAEADAETDRKFILKLMGMYEYDPSKYENLHREAEILASTESDPKYKHVLGLIEKAKEKALQSLANQDRYQAGIEGMDEDLYEGNKSLSELLK